MMKGQSFDKLEVEKSRDPGGEGYCVALLVDVVDNQ